MPPELHELVDEDAEAGGDEPQWAGIAISARSADVRAAQQLAMLASLPPLAVFALMAFNVITPFGLALGLAAALLIIDVLDCGGSDRDVRPGTARHRHAQLTPQFGKGQLLDTSKERRPAVTATLKLAREGFAIELRRGTFDVLVDGNSVGSIEWHDTIETPVGSGRHTLRIRRRRYSSRRLTFDVADGETADFRCHGANLWPIYVASIAVPTLGISLRRQ